MSKAKKGTKENPIVINVSDLANAAKKLRDAELKEGRTINIIEAKIKDDFCHYSYEVIKGKDTGFTHSVKGTGIIDDDMRTAFSKLNVHLAVIDDVYKHSDIQIGNIDSMHSDELALLYNVTGFKIKGAEDNASIILVGNKYLSAGARMELEAPKIAIDSLSSYKWYNELKAASDTCLEEVALYHYGKYTPVEKEEEEEDDPNQGNLFDKDSTVESEEEFENAKM